MPGDRKVDLGRKFLIARTAKNYTQNHVAKQVGIAQSHYHKIETGKCQPGVGQLIRLCLLLDISFMDCLLLAADRKTLRQCDIGKLFLVQDNSESNAAMQQAFDSILKKRDRQIARQKRDINGLETDGYGIKP